MTAWQNDAACRGMCADVFFPSRGQHEAIRRAVAVCRGCPVRIDCLDWVMTLEAGRERIGVFGGLTADQRRDLARRRRRTA